MTLDHTYGLFIYSIKTCLRGKTPPRLGRLALASGRRRTYLTILEMADHALLILIFGT
jgi:hypothetical protein